MPFARFNKRFFDRAAAEQFPSPPNQAIMWHVSVFRQGREVVAALYAAGGTGKPGELLPTLYRARLVTMTGDIMLFQGWERPRGYDQKDTDVNKQEWSVKLMADSPEVPPPSIRLTC